MGSVRQVSRLRGSHAPERKGDLRSPEQRRPHLRNPAVLLTLLSLRRHKVVRKLCRCVAEHLRQTKARQRMNVAAVAHSRGGEAVCDSERAGENVVRASAPSVGPTPNSVALVR
jgi:hypothetical protein